jgi:hypothetical protein
MERINPRQQFITKELVHPDTHYDLWKKYKTPSEELYLVDIPKEDFLYTSSDTIIESIVGYLTVGCKYQEHQVIRNSTDNWQRNFESYLKFVWLTESYLNNEIKFPVGGHWNPRIERNVFHPGGARNVILKLFHNGPIRTVYFNTGGKTFNWLTNATPITVNMLEQIYSHKVQFILTADHGSLIPHVHFDAKSIDNSIPNYHFHIVKLLKNNIYINYSLDDRFAGLPVTDNKYAGIRILFKDPPSLEDQFRALILWPINKKKIEIGNILIEKDMIDD